MDFIVDIVLFDFAKTFNVFSHYFWLDELRLLDICSPLTDSIVDFLIGRVMRVSVTNIRSNFINVRGDVP